MNRKMLFTSFLYCAQQKSILLYYAYVRLQTARTIDCHLLIAQKAHVSFHFIM